MTRKHSRNMFALCQTKVLPSMERWYPIQNNKHIMLHRTSLWGTNEKILQENLWFLLKLYSHFIWDLETNSSHFPPKNRPLIGWWSRLTNHRPEFWQKMAGNNFSTSDRMTTTLVRPSPLWKSNSKKHIAFADKN